MSLQTAIADWRSTYDQTEINAYNPAYIGSIRDISGGFHTGSGIYVSGTNQIYNFNVYAGQGVDHATPADGGGKFVVESTAATGFAWNTVDTNGNGKYEFVTSGQLNKLSLGYTPSGDIGAAPAATTLASFETSAPLLVVNGFNIAVDYAASLFGTGYNGNTAINVSATASDGTVLSSILANASLYESATLNSTVLYSLAFDNTSVQAFEWVLDKYLESKGSDITDDWADIQTALSGTGVSISYYDYAPSSAVAADAYAVAAAEVESDLLLAA
ncbi:hypothetical protein R5022_18845 [Pseudomonas aeruginosa]|uniref:hypothetical protein n=1 Tax=Pseudomonas aeruginosa TaxID=287 RepID=UPI00295EF0E7|nr:hypothetical protein [Pseudomonas aeruginosa]WOU23871.1 hypothetical protein R5022_18845 [Pseudomonas aeruginosa]HBY2266960.1 hypothetical protein [Klebsiella pneumoniae]HBY2299633.1 hypothetical protein [Klebsiella pneumoniae]HBY2349473.1 hypothetical protein [Klebsiella pneumoniae]